MGPGTQRLFFALWPDDRVRRALGELAERGGLRHGRRVPLENLHITLVFLGAVTPEQRACVESVAGTLRVPAFLLTLDRTGWWRRPQVFWAGASEVPPPLLTLVDGLRSGCQGCGFPPEERPFAAHATLARKVAGPPRGDAPGALAWPVEAFSLVESHLAPEGSVYRVLRTWPLEPRASVG